MPSKSPPHIALVHDYLTQRGGAERVVIDLANAFPNAPLFTSLFEPSLTFPEFQNFDVHPSPLNRLGFFRQHHRLALPLYAPTFSAMEINADVVICSSSGWAHGVPVTEKKIVYCHAPARWLYQRDRYLRESGVVQRIGLNALSPWLRKWDQKAAKSADAYLVNSSATQTMVQDAYGIDATIVHPPISIDAAGPQRPVEGVEPGFFLVVARLLSYKNVHLTLEAARKMSQRVVVVGDGPMRVALEQNAAKSVAFLGTVDDETLRWCYANCQAHVAMSYEDYGLSPIEAAAFGKPTIALGAGGYLDTVRNGETGLHVKEATTASLVSALREFTHLSFSEQAITDHAALFSKERFVRSLQEQVAAVLA